MTAGDRPVWWSDPLVPTLFFQGYLWATIVAFFAGPWRWPLNDPVPLLAFVSVYHVALLAGGLAARLRRTRVPLDSDRRGTRRLFRASVAITLLLFWPTVRWLTAGAGDPLLALRDPGAAYYAYQDLAAQGRPTSWVSVARFAAAPLLALPIPLVAVLWYRLSPGWRIAGVLAAVANAAVFSLTGRNKGLAELVLLLPFAIALALAHRPGTTRARLTLRTLVLLLALPVLFAGTYLRNHLARQGAGDTAIRVALLDGIDADPDHPLLTALPTQPAILLLGLTFNQTHGYLGMAMALGKPFQTCWGAGHTYIVQRAVEQRLTRGRPLCLGSYIQRLESEDGYSASQFWHTAYTWFANDVSFFGVPVVLFALGYLLGATWRDATREQDALAAGLALIVITILFYLPMNNVVLGQPEGLMSFWVLLALWSIRRRSRRSAAGPAE